MNTSCKLLQSKKCLQKKNDKTNGKSNETSFYKGQDKLMDN
jgi:hypothetical protein